MDLQTAAWFVLAISGVSAGNMAAGFWFGSRLSYHRRRDSLSGRRVNSRSLRRVALERSANDHRRYLDDAECVMSQAMLLTGLCESHGVPETVTEVIARLVAIMTAMRDQIARGAAVAEELARVDHVRHPGGGATKSPEPAKEALTMQEIAGLASSADQADGPKDGDAATKRYRYSSRQSLLPRYGSDVPDVNDLLPVTCHDLSSGGLSFFTSQEPDYKQFYVSLGVGSERRFMLAEVKSHRSVYMYENMGYLVNAQFQARVGWEAWQDAVAGLETQEQRKPTNGPLTITWSRPAGPPDLKGKAQR